MEAQAGAGDDAATIVMKDTRNNLLRTGYDSPIGRRVYLRNIQESSQSAAHTGTGTLVLQATAPSWCEWRTSASMVAATSHAARRGKARQLTVAVAVASPS